MQSILQYIRAAVFALIISTSLSAVLVHAQGGFQDGLTKVGDNAAFTQSAIRSDEGVIGAIADIISMLLAISGAIAVLAVIYGGFLYLTSGGNEGQAKTGQQVLTYAIIGTIVIILSYVIIEVIVVEFNIATT